MCLRCEVATSAVPRSSQTHSPPIRSRAVAQAAYNPVHRLFSDTAEHMQDLAAGPAINKVDVRKLNQDFRRCATDEDKQKIDSLVGNPAKAAYRLTWHKERLTHVTGRQTLKESETKTDCSDGWYMNELQLVQDLGGLIDEEKTQAQAAKIMKHDIATE